MEGALAPQTLSEHCINKSKKSGYQREEMGIRMYLDRFLNGPLNHIQEFCEGLW